MPTTYYVSTGPDGSDSNNGLNITNTTGPTGPFATVAKGAISIAIKDTLLLVTNTAGDVFNETTTVEFSGITPQEGDPPQFIIGVNSVGVDDGTIAKVDGHSIWIKQGPDFGTNNFNNMLFKNVKVQNCTGAGWQVGEIGNPAGPNFPIYASNNTFINCHAMNCEKEGFSAPAHNDSSADDPFSFFFINCSSVRNGSDGFFVVGRGMHYYACFAEGNKGNGFVSNGGDTSTTSGPKNNSWVANATFNFCIAARNNSAGFKFFRSLINCVMFENLEGCQTPRTLDASAGIGMDGIFPLINCIFEGNINDAIDNNWNATSQPVSMINCAFFNNGNIVGDIDRAFDIGGKGTTGGLGIPHIALPASPFLDTSGEVNDFRLDQNTVAGRMCMRTAYPIGDSSSATGLYVDGVSLNVMDLGAMFAEKSRVVVAG